MGARGPGGTGAARLKGLDYALRNMAVRYQRLRPSGETRGGPSADVTVAGSGDVDDSGAVAATGGTVAQDRRCCGMGFLAFPLLNNGGWWRCPGADVVNSAERRAKLCRGRFRGVSDGGRRPPGVPSVAEMHKANQ